MSRFAQVASARFDPLGNPIQHCFQWNRRSAQTGTEGSRISEQSSLRFMAGKAWGAAEQLA
jgi:hypothetical protein